MSNKEEAPKYIEVLEGYIDKLNQKLQGVEEWKDFDKKPRFATL